MTDLSDSVEPDLALASFVARIADDSHGHDIVVLNVGPVLSITGYFVIASATNVRLVRTVAEEIEAAVKEEFGRGPVRIEGMREQQWVLLDYGDVVVHVFLDEVHEFYDIERLYRDVERVDWTIPGPAEVEEA